MSAEGASSSPSTSTAKPWREQLQTLRSHLLSERHGKASSLVLRILRSSSEGEYPDDPIPRDVLETLRTVRARCLIRRGCHEELIEFCRTSRAAAAAASAEAGKGPPSLALEEAYGLYRTRRYVDCKDLCGKALSSATDDGGDRAASAVVGLRHLRCQALYRLHETSDATLAYEELLASQGGEDDERDETTTNLLASVIANATRSGSSADGRLVKLAEERRNAAVDGGGDNYDLAYNLGTYKLLTANSSSELHGALSALIDAEKTCVRVLTEDMDDDANDEAEEEIDAEAGPIRCNVALCKLLLGTVGGIDEAIRSYEKILKSEGNAGGSKVAATNNLAVLKVGKESLFDSLKRLPRVSGGGENGGVEKADNAENGSGGGAGSSSPSAGGGSAATMLTPHQVRSVLFNRSLFLLRMNKLSECREALNALKIAVTTTSGDDKNKKAGGKRVRKKKKKKGGAAAAAAAASSEGAGARNVEAVVPPAPPANGAERMLWLNAIDAVESEVLAREGKAVEATKVLEDAKSRVEDALKTAKDDDDEERRALEYALAELILYDRERDRRGSSSSSADDDDDDEDVVKRDVEALERLPPSVRSRPAVVAALSSRLESIGRTDEAAALLASFRGANVGADGEEGGESKEALLASADAKLSSGSYEDAAIAYEKALDKMMNDDGDDEEGQERTDVTAKLVVALSHFDPDKAEEFASSLPSSLVDDEEEEVDAAVDGEELESMDVPRFSSSKARTRKLIARDGAARGDGGSKEKKKKNHESVLRQRSKRRSLYLSELERLGKYDPSRPSKPDPERWIPKNQRSYAKRGRRGRHKFSAGGAQGGGTGYGAEKDTAKLDVAARKKAVEEGAPVGGGSSLKPSTAHMGVSSGGGGKRRGGRR